MSRPETKFYLSVAEYFAGEQHSAVRHEYVDGQVYAMAGASARHYRLARNLCRRLEDHLPDSNCEAFMFDMKVRADDKVYYYPDVVVTCEKLTNKEHLINEPVFIIEVLSPGTQRIDRHEKLLAYKSLDSLREYAIVWQDEMRLELHRRNDTDAWQTFYFSDANAAIDFASVKLEVRLAEIYRNVTFEPPQPADEFGS